MPPEIGPGSPVRPLAVPATFVPRLTVADVLRLPGLAGSLVVAGAGGLDRPLEQVNVMQVPTDRYVKPDELVLAAATAFAAPQPRPAGLVTALARRGVAALAVRGAPLNELMGLAALRAADRFRLPLVELPDSVHLSEVQAEVLGRIVAVQATELKLALDVRDRLADAVLAGGDLAELTGTIGEIVEADVVVTDSTPELLACSPGADTAVGSTAAAAWLAAGSDEPVEIRDWVVWPITAGRRRLGCIAARFSTRYTRVRLAALEHGATVAALQLLHRGEARAADARLHAGFVRDLLSGSLDPASAARRAEAVGWSPEQTFRALVVDAGPETLERTAEWLRTNDPPGLVTEHAGGTLVLVPAAGPDAAGEDDPSLRVALGLGDGPLVHVGVSDVHEGLEPLPIAVWEAQQALRAAVLFGARSPVRRYEDLGLLSLLVDVPPEELRRFRDDVLAPIEGLRPGYAGALRATLDALVDCGLNVALTARHGGWHYNTVRSRVARLEDLLGPFMEDGTVLDSVALALLLDRELTSAGKRAAGAVPARAERRTRARPATVLEGRATP